MSRSRGSELRRQEGDVVGDGLEAGLAADVGRVGVADDLGGGFGMTKPSLVPQPPALLSEPKPVKEKETSQAVPMKDLEEEFAFLNGTLDALPGDQFQIFVGGVLKYADPAKLLWVDFHNAIVL